MVGKGEMGGWFPGVMFPSFSIAQRLVCPHAESLRGTLPGRLEAVGVDIFSIFTIFCVKVRGVLLVVDAVATVLLIALVPVAPPLFFRRVEVDIFLNYIF